MTKKVEVARSLKSTQTAGDQVTDLVIKTHASKSSKEKRSDPRPEGHREQTLHVLHPDRADRDLK